MADLVFDVAKKRKKPITFTLGGDNMLLRKADPETETSEKRGEDDNVYSFTPPKTALMLMPILEGGDPDGMGMTRATLNWLGEGLTEEENQRILARLKDPQDDLDVDNLTDIIKALSERVGGRPTG